ncbi:MAG: dephospho-CoA kinase [Bacteroidota bacterium]
MALTIGLTGGMGSGKTTVGRSFEALGYQVYYADDRAKLLYDVDDHLKRMITQVAGSDVYDSNDKLIRARLSEKIFQDKALLSKVNALVHPAVKRDFESWREAIPETYARPFILKEAAILFEAGTDTALDGVITVYAPKRTRLARVLHRDGTHAEHVLARMNHQWPDGMKILCSDFIIYNDGLHAISTQIAASIRHFSER